MGFQEILPFIFIVVFGVMLGQWFSSKTMKKKMYHRIKIVPVDVFKKNMRKGQLIDLRKSDRFEKDRIKGARNFSMRYLKNKRQTLVRKDQDLYLYCQNGKKSARVARKLLSRFPKELYVLDGGFNAYKASKTNTK